MKTLYLYGPPGSGKSTLARQLAREWGRFAIDLDDEIVRRTGRSIPDIFAHDGEREFRRIESETLRAVDAPIVALGGGTLLDGANRAFAEDHGMVAVLEVDADTVAARVASGGGSRPLGDRFAERRAHYESFPHRIDARTRVMLPRPLRGAVTPPVSKSHLHRLLIAEFLSGGKMAVTPCECADLVATRRCLDALANVCGPGSRDSGGCRSRTVTLDVGESGSTLRFLAPLVAALGLKADFIRHGRLAERPMIEYERLEPGVRSVRGDVSSQFVTGLLFALPLLSGDSDIVFTTPLQSRGYVDMTLRVLARYGIRVDETSTGFHVPGHQRYVSPGNMVPEADWSGAAFWFAANSLGSELTINGLAADSQQPDRRVCELIAVIERINRGETDGTDGIDVSGCPDLYPALAVVNAFHGGKARFVGTERLRLKESDRLAAVDELLANPQDVHPRNDHRIAMAAAVLSTVADGPTLIHEANCVAKSYPGFFDEFRMDLYAVTGWPLARTLSPELHNRAHAAAGRKAEMIAFPSSTVERALDFARQCGAKGMAVTIPHKEKIIPLLDEVDPDAAVIGAVNTVVFRNGRSCGYNTDADGFSVAVRKFVGRDDFSSVRAVLLGNGGAAKAVRHALERLGAAVETWHRREIVPAAHPLASPELTLFVNATPVDPIPDYDFTGDELVYDLVYVPAQTPLIVHAKACGCRTENGFSMLRFQADRQLRLFCS